MSTPCFLVGLDLGQAQDFTAWVVLERHDGGAEPATYGVRYIERERGATYPAVVDHTRSLVGALRSHESRPEVILVVDFTGVGRPVADLLAKTELDAELRLVTITAGDAVTRGERAEWRVPKRDLAAVVQVQLQTGRLRISEHLVLARTLTDELVNFRVKISLTGHDSYGAGADWREGNHDDLVLALALACWWGERMRPHIVPVLLGLVGGKTFFPMSEASMTWDADSWDDDPWS